MESGEAYDCSEGEGYGGVGLMTTSIMIGIKYM